MVGRIRSTGTSSVSAIGSGDAKGGSRTGGTLRKLAGRVAGRMAREFKLIDEFDTEEESDRHPGGPLNGEDIYDIRQAARDLTTDLNGKPADEGRLGRSLDGFVQESAALLAARPDAASLDTIARLIRDNDTQNGPETVDRSLGQIDQTTREIAESKPR